MSQRQATFRSLALAIVVFSLPACDKDPAATGGTEAPKISKAELQEIAEARAAKRGSEKAMFALAEEHPAFAGFYINENNEWTIRITDSKHAEEVRQDFGRFIEELAVTARDSEMRNRAIVFLPAEYSFPELDIYRTLAEEVILPLEGVVQVDLDEGRNRVVIGIAEEHHRKQVQEVMAELEVAVEAFVITVTGWPELLAAATPDGFSFGEAQWACDDITQYCRPAVGGVKIRLNRNGEWGWCTLTGAARQGESIVFVTASHCSDVQWGLDHEFFAQGSLTDSLGVEILDPPSWACGFLNLWDCRRSDALLATPFDPEDVLVGKIARLLPGTFQPDPVVPTFSIVSQRDGYKGDLAFMVGATTGETSGFVKETCVTIGGGGWRKLVCNDKVAFFPQPDHGDSGAPVYTGADGGAALLGLMWGGSPVEGRAYVSPVSGIIHDLGSLDFVNALQVTILGDRTPIRGTVETYTASVSGASGSLSYTWERDGVVVSTGSSYDLPIPVGDPTPIQLTLTVTDGYSGAIDSAMVSPSISVSIFGPTLIRPGATCTWTGSPSGTAPYAFSWYNDNLYVGSGEDYTGSKDPGNLGSSFSLRLDVTDAYGFPGTQTIEVVESETAPICFQ